MPAYLASRLPKDRFYRAAFEFVSAALRPCSNGQLLGRIERFRIADANAPAHFWVKSVPDSGKAAALPHGLLQPSTESFKWHFPLEKPSKSLGENLSR
jgi:hypothetical protein